MNLADAIIRNADLSVVSEAPTQFVAVSHEIFLTWDHETQMRYCALRDYHSARLEDINGDLDAAAWYRKRAQSFMNEIMTGAD